MDRWPSKLPINGQSCRRVEVLAGPERRRQWSWEEKARAAESLAPDAAASSVTEPPSVLRDRPLRPEVCTLDPPASGGTS